MAKRFSLVISLNAEAVIPRPAFAAEFLFPPWGRTVLISLYSGASGWLLLPSDKAPPPSAVALLGPLIREATIPSNVVIVSVWRRMQGELHEHGYCRISEDLALLLLEECIARHGTKALSSLEGNGEAPAMGAAWRPSRSTWQ
jgi:hypothetical protein